MKRLVFLLIVAIFLTGRSTQQPLEDPVDDNFINPDEEQVLEDLRLE